MMLRIVVLVSIFVSTSAWSYQALMRQSEMMAKTRRDPIQMPTQTPMVPYKPPGSDYSQFVDLNTRMLRDRTMMICKFIDEDAANEIISMLLYLRKESMSDPIDIYLNCPGALLRPGLAVYDLICQTRQQVEVRTVNLGLCAGIGALLVGAGTKGNRRAMPNSRFLVQHTGMENPFRGQASDIGLEVKSMIKSNERLDLELHKMTGQPIPKIRQDLTRDFYLFADEAVQYGLIDEVFLPTFNKRAATGADADLGSFQGETQRYQGQESGDGFGSQQQVQRQKEKDDDYDGPEVVKG
mmetsp:Transcript_24409/g.36219  ORF Transcript_24409/g.36219 Transcript_24409/m.36219 type:complete len:296 (+) Transcript_24409:75-962(+)|eukprot:CAMPEP_0194203128 /NCGR_PEP_ID=MMETSP0156-20130528/2988_1 /TAXON_ID=33649 /ORGANISM="Thalassionema nitzschioides, Strain L26-B" /LENGTH=295 /DNA_ID=CAMNT_0038928819 /DNA_START=71 /DNA_END=958 /DNA_ORIENTATION=-